MSRSTYPTQLRDHLGNEVRLPAKPFATGGEGAVFDVVGRPDLVAKLYSKPQSRDRCDKLQAMAKLCSPDLLKFAAWPTATLSTGNPAVVEGILMPRITDHKEIHCLYSVAQRKKDFPEADWGFLLHTARNCAIAFESVHSHGHVVGDVNQKNLMVSKKGIVALVDCDSFQVKDRNRIFRCGVGVPEYTPPELHGRKFTDLDRDANHDLFGLAVMVFHLLMMGRHPFAGVPQVNVDIPIEKAIQDGLYAYARNPTKLKPPPNVLPLAKLDAPTRDLFERAFGSAQRPTATEWCRVLDASMMGLQHCKNEPKHSYPVAAGSCPWCQLIAIDRLMFFIPSQGAAGTTLRLEDILGKTLNDCAATWCPIRRSGLDVTNGSQSECSRRLSPKPSAATPGSSVSTCPTRRWTAVCTKRLVAVKGVGSSAEIDTLWLDRVYDSDITRVRLAERGVTDAVIARRRKRGDQDTERHSRWGCVGRSSGPTRGYQTSGSAGTPTDTPVTASPNSRSRSHCSSSPNSSTGETAGHQPPHQSAEPLTRR